MGSKQVAIHDGGKYGRVLVDLTKAGSFDVASGAFVGGAGEGEWTWFDRVVVAHGGVFFFFFSISSSKGGLALMTMGLLRPSAAVCGGLAWAVFAPFAVLVGRFGRHLHGKFSSIA